LVVARDSGNRKLESIAEFNLGRLEAQHGDDRAALALHARSIRSYRDWGDTSSLYRWRPSSSFSTVSADSSRLPPSRGRFALEQIEHAQRTI